MRKSRKDTFRERSEIEMKVITLTLNPAFDVHCQCDGFEVGKESLAKITSRQAAGKGVNISRALCSLDTENLAFCLLGEENAEEFEKMLSNDKVEFLSLKTSGRIRENYTLHSQNRPETRISFSGFDFKKEKLSMIEEMILPLVEKGTVVTITGRLPQNLSAEDLKPTLDKFKAKGALLVIDSKSYSLSDLIINKPWLIKPNEEEIAEYLHKDAKSLEAATEGAKSLHAMGIENVMISLGEKGALLCCDNGVYLADAPKVNVVSTVGAGDSSLAGFIWAKLKKQSDTAALTMAVSCGSAACESEGSTPPDKELIKKLINEIESKTL